MDERAPAVVVVMATRDPGPWFDEVLEAWADQDYEELSVLVMVSDGTKDPTGRVAAVLPDAFVRRLDQDRGFGAAANEVLGMVEGAAFYVFCHDDCAPGPGAVRSLVEESFRSNAGIVSPKMVRWDDRRVLLHVGMSVDKTGAVVERVHPDEVDHGQHDAVRDVFCAPGGMTLVRADLFAQLGGYDPAITAMGEDLDLSWRAQVAGARVVVAPEAWARHLEVLAGGGRSPAPEGPDRHHPRARHRRSPDEAARDRPESTDLAGTAADKGGDGVPPPSLQDLQRRHELRSVLTCYTMIHLVRVVPQALLLAAGEIVVALVAGNWPRARAVARAWQWNLSHLGEIRRARRRIATIRFLPDGEVRRLQLRGSARLSTYIERMAHQEFDAAHGLGGALGRGSLGRRPGRPEPPTSTSGLHAVPGTAREPVPSPIGAAFSESTDEGDFDDLGHRAGEARGRPPHAILATARARLALGALVAVVVVVGSRGIILARFPLLGQFLPVASWSATWHQFAAGWQPPGLGSTSPPTPAYAVLGAAGTILFGAMGLAQKVLVLGWIPLGAWGVARLLRPIAGPRGRIVGSVAYLALPLAWDALAQGRWDGLVAFGLAPWLVGRLVTVADVKGRLSARQVVAFSLLEALGVAFAPALGPAIVASGVAVSLGSLLVGRLAGWWRPVYLAVAGTVGAAIACGPWAIGALVAGKVGLDVFGLPLAPASPPPWTSLLRFAVGPMGDSALSWLLVAAALLPLVIGRQSRLAAAARLWVVACASWVLALVAVRGWAGSFTPSLDVVLAPAAVAVAASVGIGVAAFERDLSGYRFGWRQALSGASMLAVVVGTVPFLAAAGDGRWAMPATGYAQDLSFVSSPGHTGPYRVLWLGNPRALPLGGWSIARGLAYGTSEGGTPDTQSLWAPAAPGAASTLATAVTMAQKGLTTHLGLLLAAAGIRYIVVPGDLAPPAPGATGLPQFPPPTGLVAALKGQSDLQEIPGGAGFTVLENTAYIPVRAQRATPLLAAPATAPLTHTTPTVLHPNVAGATGWHPVLAGPAGSTSYRGELTPGTFYAGYAPAADWQLVTPGGVEPSSPAYGWAATYRVGISGPAELRFTGGHWGSLALAAETAVWFLAALVLAGPRRVLVPLGRAAARAGRRARAARGARRDRRAAGPRRPADPIPKEAADLSTGSVA